MAEVINGVKVPFIPIVPKQEVQSKNINGPKQSFDEIFRHEIEKVKFSGHALKRLESRNIKLDETEMQKLNEAVSKAKMKGARDSLVMMNDKAFIVNVPNRTVVTAMDIQNNEENIFTNIDSVVFAK